MDSDSDSSVVLNLLSEDEEDEQEFVDALEVGHSDNSRDGSQGDLQDFNMDPHCMHSAAHPIQLYHAKPLSGGKETVIHITRPRSFTQTLKYLGQELEVVRGRTVFEEGEVVTLDLLQAASVVLMPGQTLPLTVFDSPTINMLRNCIRNDKTFGVLASWPDSLTYRNGTMVDVRKQSEFIKGIGITVEIYEYLPEEGLSGFRVKARARQRFKMLEADTNKWRARVRILPEVKLPDPLEGVRLLSLCRYRSSPQMRHRCRRADAAVTRWPAFVYEQYNVDRLVQEVKQLLSSTLMSPRGKNKEKEIECPTNITIPDDPSELSFWVAQNVPMKEDHRLMLLNLNSPVQRLQWELKALQQSKQLLYCHSCMNSVGSSSDMFSMSAEGPQSTYVNPNGYLHETITLHRVRNIYSVGHASTEFSWFPGYAWTISKCKHCHEHMGWKFTATKSSLRPAKFWGICRRSIAVKWVVPMSDLDPDVRGTTNNMMLA